MNNKVIPDDIPRPVQHSFELFQELRNYETPEFERYFNKFKQSYEELESKDRYTLFRLLNERMEVRKHEVEEILHSLLESQDQGKTWASLLKQLRETIISPRQEIFQRIARNPGGLKFLLDFRGDILAARRGAREDFDALDADIAFLLEMLFQEGFLYLEEITLDSPYSQIQLIKDRDLVHPMTSLEEMGQRLGKDRRCFALYHRMLPIEPIIFIEVALTGGLVKRISDIVGHQDSENNQKGINTAIFYSINNTQNGLAGLGLGKLLIGRVVDFLRREDERIKNFATLSPMPGFWPSYLKPILEGNDEKFNLKYEDVASYFSKKARAKILSRFGVVEDDIAKFNQALLDILSTPDWVKDEDLVKELKSPLVKIAYHYIAKEKDSRGRPLNPVAGFHMGNGASVSERYVNFLANPSPRGISESCGIMVNYIYTSGWLTQLRRSFRWLEKVEIKGLFRRQ